MIDIPADKQIVFSEFRIDGNSRDGLSFTWETDRLTTSRCRYRLRGERFWKYSHERGELTKQHHILSSDKFTAGEWQIELGSVTQDRTLHWSQTHYFTMARRSDRMTPAERWERIDRARRWGV